MDLLDMLPKDLVQELGFEESYFDDAISETSSESTTSSGTSISAKPSLGNAKDLKEFAAAVGVANLFELQPQCFVVNRQKLEQMVFGDNSIIERADVFFPKVMRETSTFITWPRKLRMGARSKKDLHVTVFGLPDSIEMAKEMITSVLGTRKSERVTMKMSVSCTDHSHIIGKGGLRVKKLMDETSCHIHFPDSNMISAKDQKSNRVYITGDMEGVEKARAQIRNLTPVIFSFELPYIVQPQPEGSATMSGIDAIREKYNVQVIFSTRQYDTLVMVKGVEWRVAKVKEATALVIHHMFGLVLSDRIEVQMSMEISPVHHNLVLGYRGNNVKQIALSTGARIRFPNVSDETIPSNLRKSHVTITGSIDNVYAARQQMIDSLPMDITFELPEESINIYTLNNVDRLMQTLNVQIILHERRYTLATTVRGMERNASNVYEARRQLLSLDAHC